MKFFCRIIEPTGDGFKVKVNTKNINLIPEHDHTVRRIYLEASVNLEADDLLYVDHAEFTDNRVVVKDFYKLSKLETSVKNTTTFTSEVCDMVVTQDVFPIELYNHINDIQPSKRDDVACD